MYKKLCLFIFVLAFFIFADSVKAETYYVDYENGNDSNNGLSRENPWKHVPGDDNAIEVVAQIFLNPGDIVRFKEGIEYYGQIFLRWNGEEGNPIIYIGGFEDGVDKAIISGRNTHTELIKGSNKNDLIFDNFEIRDIPKNYDVPWENGAFGLSGVNERIIIRNNYFHNIGYWQNDGSTSISGGAIGIISPIDCIIENNEITKTGAAGISFNGGHNSVIRNNDIHHYINWGISIGGDYTESYGHKILNNKIHDLYHYDSGFWGGSGEPPHQDFVFIRKGSGQRPHDILVEGNLFYNNYEFVDNGGTAMVFLSYADNITIKNNIFINPHSYYTISMGWSSNNNLVINNTVYGSSGIRMTSMEEIGTNKIYNNAVIGYSDIVWEDNDDTLGWSLDYNAYFSYNSEKTHSRVSPYGRYTLAEFQSEYSQDLNSIYVSQIEDFKFTDISAYRSSCETMDFLPKSDSPLCGAGKDGLDIGAIPCRENDYEQNTQRADVNNDSQVDLKDVLLTLRNSLGFSMVATAWRESDTTGDVNCDGAVSVVDAFLSFQKSIGLDMSNTAWCSN